VAVGGQQLTVQGLGGVYDEIFLPLHGNHQADNAALALAAVEAFFGAGVKRQLDVDAVREGFAAVTSPARLEPIRSAPTVLLDAAHNPHGARALAKAIDEEFAFRRLVGVVSIMSDKNAAGILAELEGVLSDIVLTRNSTQRAMNSDELADIAKEIFGEERIHVEPNLPDAIDTAIGLADEVTEPGQSPAGAGVLITGSVLTVGEARTIFGKDPL
ncbi:MAG: dihydrofolate synthase, partial [Sciscionella sp.]|nr:dihydrofolate synthase [Sciscionella sp.]